MIFHCVISIIVSGVCKLNTSDALLAFQTSRLGAVFVEKRLINTIEMSMVQLIAMKMPIGQLVRTIVIRRPGRRHRERHHARLLPTVPLPA